MDVEKRKAEYEICQRRGHEASGNVLTSIPSWDVCRWCGTSYRMTTPELVEMNVPE